MMWIPRRRRNWCDPADRVNRPLIAVFLEFSDFPASADPGWFFDAGRVVVQEVRIPGDHADSVGKVDAGDGEDIVADERRDDFAAVAPIAEVGEACFVADGLVERPSGEGGLESGVANPPEASAVHGVDFAQVHLEGPKDAF